MAPRKRGSKDIAWNHCAVVDPSETKHLRCNYCGKDYWGGVTRMKHHLAGIRNECTICEKVPDEVKEIFAKLLSSKKTKNEANNICLPEDSAWMDVHEDFSFSGEASSSKRKRGPRNLNAKFEIDKRRKGKAKVRVDEVEEIDEDEDEDEDADNCLKLVDEEDLSDIDLQDFE